MSPSAKTVTTTAACSTSVSVVSATVAAGTKSAHASSFITLIEGDCIEPHNELMHVLMHQLLLCRKMRHLLFLVDACGGSRVGRELALIRQSSHLCGDGFVDGVIICFFGAQSAECILAKTLVPGYIHGAPPWERSCLGNAGMPPVS